MAGLLWDLISEFFQINLFVLPDGTEIGLWIFPLILAVILGALGIRKYIEHKI